MTSHTTKSPGQFKILLASFFVACLAMWFGVFKLHIYDATNGIKHTIGPLVLALDWIVITATSLIILHNSFLTRHKKAKAKNLSLTLKVSNLLATSLATAGLIVLIIIVGFFILAALALWRWNF